MLLFKSRKAQSTAEYAIVLGLVVAVVAGVLQTALKGGVRQKNKEALGYLLDSGNITNFDLRTQAKGEKLYSQTYQKTTVSKSEDVKVMGKGGSEKGNQTQISSTEAVSVELLNATQ